MASIQKSVDSSSLAEVIDRILDKGVVIDIWARVSLVGIELLTIDARIVIASVETWLKYADAVGLLDKDNNHKDKDWNKDWDRDKEKDFKKKS
jgi:hypothetical protein